MSAKKFSLYPEGVTHPSQGQRPWYTVAVLTAAPAGHNNHRTLLLCPAGAEKVLLQSPGALPLAGLFNPFGVCPCHFPGQQCSEIITFLCAFAGE